MDQLGMFQDEEEHSPLKIPPGANELTDDNGVYKVILKQGVGKDRPAKGSRVTVHYTGRLPGKEEPFDSSYNRGQKFSFNVGRSEVIKGWDLCVASMLKGEKCRMQCAPKYGYGVRGSPPKIPANAVLEFEIELFEWEGEDLSPEGDKSIMREMLQEGEDFTMPNIGAKVEMQLVGWWKDGKQEKRFCDETITYHVDEADASLNLPPGIDVALKRMKRKEKSRLRVAPKYGFGANGNEKLGIPPETPLIYELTLKQFAKAKEAWEMTDEERIERSREVKEEGNGYFRKQSFQKAVIEYKKILDYLEFHDAKEEDGDDERRLLEESRKLKLIGCTNLAACYNKLKKHKEAVDICGEALKLDSNNEKALYRAGEGYFEQKEFSDAKTYFKKVLVVNPGNKQARTFLDRCAEEAKKKDDQERQKYEGMFDKFRKEDEENEIRKKVTEQSEKAKAKKAARQDAKSDEPNEGNS